MQTHFYTIAEIIDFLKDVSKTDNIKADSDIFKDIGMSGDDFHETIEEYANRFSVDMTNYLWYFHADEEGSFSIGSIFFKPPYVRVERMPISPNLLLNFANTGRWDIKYPPHKLPTKRYDILINQIFSGFILLTIIIWLIKKYLI